MTMVNLGRVAQRIVPDGQLRDRTFPRRLEMAQLYLSFVLLELPCLTLAKVADVVIQSADIKLSIEHSDQRVRGCMVAHAGSGFIFVDTEDDENERRFTLAHELVHFVGHYMIPREDTIERLGANVAEVLDGIREPTADERISAVFSRCHIGPYKHSMPRTYGSDTAVLEDEADLGALHVLAPLGEVLRTMRDVGGRDRQAWTMAVSERFGVPEWA